MARLTRRAFSSLLALAAGAAAFRGNLPVARPLRKNVDLKAHAVGIDVGTGSARCGVFSLEGKLLASHAVPITMFQPPGKNSAYADYYQQSSADIWQAICTATKTAITEAGVAPADTVGIGFDATCSLVCLGEDDEPRGVDPTCPDDAARNVVVWLDHRAQAQAARINAGQHPALQTVGGVISLEMQVPKLLWLKENLPGKWLGSGGDGAFAKFFDLADWLVYKATGKDARSLCTTVCKWNYDALGTAEGNGGQPGWDAGFLASLGLSELLVNAPNNPIGSLVSSPGEPVGSGLQAAAAEALGLPAGTPVGVAMIDAHAGGLGVLGALVPPLPGCDDGGDCGEYGDANGGGDVVSAAAMETRMALIAGTSCCHMLSSAAPVFVPGVWGPYKDAMVPGLALNEGGQSAAGKLLDHVTTTHAAYPELLQRANQPAAKGTPYAFLDQHLLAMADAAQLPHRKVGLLTQSLHVYPDFFGNRSPLADPLLRGGVTGLGQAANVDDLALLYLATLQALAYQTKHILDACEDAGHAPVASIFVTGGLVNNPLYLQAHADATGCVLELPREPDAVLLGAAVLGARAGGAFGSLPSAMAALNRVGGRVLPFQLECSDECDVSVPSYHACKYAVFRKMAEDQLAYRGIMEGAVLD